MLRFQLVDSFCEFWLNILMYETMLCSEVC